MCYYRLFVFLFFIIVFAFFLFFFKQKTAYEMRISEWSSDVCSSDLDVRFRAGQDLSAVEVATVSHDLEAFGFEYGLCLFVHPGKLGTVAADVDDIMGDDEMMPRVDHCLHVVAHHAGTWWPSNESQDRSGKPVGPVPQIGRAHV